MKINKFLVTVQWGGGPHYIRSSPLTEEECKEMILLHQKQADVTRRRYRRGAFPKVRGWKLMEDKG